MIRRIHRIVLLFALLIGGAGMNYVEAAVYSGTCGAAGNEANVTWELDTETGRLEISGSGPMTHYWSLQDIPWYNYRQYVTSITVRYGVTTIGHHAFYDFPNVTDISCDYVTSIGVLSFGFCRKITSLEIPESVTSIGDQALWYNESLKEVHVEWTGDAVPTMPANIHNFEASQIRLHIPCGQTAAYIAKGWDTKFTLIEGLDGGLITTTTNNFLWTLSCDSVWTVSGTGALKDFPNPLYVDLGIARVTTNISSLSPVFSKRKVVKGAVFEEGITYIGNNTLYKGTYHAGYPYLTTLTLPSTLTSMSSTAFKGCIALKDVYVSWTTAAAIPTWNQTIDVSQATLHVPCGTKSLYQAKSGWNGFIIKEERGHGTCGAEGKNLTWSLSCDGTLTIRGTGAMFNWMSLADRPWHSLCTSIQRVVIEEGVTTTGYHAFYGASNLTSVSLPSTLQTLQWMTFFGCGKLTTLTIPSSVTYVGNRSLEGCSALTDVYMSETGDAVPTMPPGIHTYDASRIRLHIPCGQAVNYIAKGWNTKFTIDGVVSGTCGDNVRWTFESCNGTLSIFGTGPMADYELAQAPWDAYKYSITSVSIAEGVTSIGTYAFYYCTSMTSISLPNSLTSIGNCAFYICGDLASVIIPNNVTNIGEYAFYYCTSLTSITIPNGVTSIKYDAFYHCTALTSVTIPNSVTSIGSCAFTSCALTSVAIPNSVTSIDYYAFSKCNSLADIYVSWTSSETIPAWQNMTSNDPQSDITLHVPCGTTSLYQAADGWKDYRITDDIASGICGATGHESDVTWSLSCDGTLTIQGTGAMADWSSSDKVPWYSYRSSITTVNIRDGVTSVGNRAFIECAVLTSVTIPNSVTSISNNALFSCSALANITIPNSVTTIGQYVFYGCSALTNITIPNSVTSLGENTFRNCSALTDIYVSWTTAVPDWPTNFTNKSPQSSITLHVPCGTGDVYAAQDGWKDYTIVANLPRVLSGTCGAIGNEANVTWSLDLCDSTLTISGTGAMRSWTSANNVPWKDYRDNIQHIVIEDGVTSIGQNSFSNCTNVTSLSIGSDVTSIGKTAFYYCTALENIIIPDNVQSIGYMAFGYCSGASTLTIGAGVNSIDQYAFISGSSLTSIVIPDNVQTLGNYAFAGCENVSFVTIGTGVNSIGDYVFALMPNITDMYVGWTTADAIPAWTTGFTQVSPQSGITLHVPCSAMSLYKAADGWKDYTIEGEGGPYTITVESDDPTMGTVDAVKIGE